MARLVSARRKVGRADEHLKALEDGIAAFINPNPYQIVMNRDPEGWEYGWFRILRPPPDALTLIAGDAAYNLRAALDHAVYQLARGGRSSEPQGTAFPIYGDKAAYTKEVRDRLLKGVGEPHRAIIDSAQPYHWTGKRDVRLHPLAVLAWFHNADKHRELHAAFTRQSRLRISVPKPWSPSDIEVGLPGGVSARADEGTRVYEWRPKPGKEDVHVDVGVQFTVGFGERGVIYAQFAQARNFVLQLIQQLEAV